MPADRYTRQRRLAEIGDAGQARLERHQAAVPPGPAGEVAAEYLRRAGVEPRPATTLSAPAFPHAECFPDAGPATLAAGSWHALRALHQALGWSTGDP